MPTYEYECRQCGHRFEAFQSIKDAPLSACERCGGEVRRLISGGAGLLFKGSGFYLTDYRSAAYKKRAQEEGGKRQRGGGGTAGAGGGMAADAAGGGAEKSGGAGAGPTGASDAAKPDGGKAGKHGGGDGGA